MIPSPLLECPQDSGQSVTFSSLVKTIHLIWGIPVAAWLSLTFIILVALNIPSLAIFAWEQKDTGPTPVNDTRLIGLILGPTHRLIHPPRFLLFTFFLATRSLSHLSRPNSPTTSILLNPSTDFSCITAPCCLRCTYNRKLLLLILC